jgi:hypothetical protein
MAIEACGLIPASEFASRISLTEHLPPMLLANFDRKFNDYFSWPGGDPGRPNWFYAWDYQGHSHYPLPWGNGAPEYSPY